MSGKRVEYGTELTWPDGRTETFACGLSLALARVEWHNTPGNSYCTVRLVQRSITVGDWAPVADAGVGEQATA